VRGRWHVGEGITWPPRVSTGLVVLDLFTVHGQSQLGWGGGVAEVAVSMVACTLGIGVLFAVSVRGKGCDDVWGEGGVQRCY
jgi:hypothetical protein